MNAFLPLILSCGLALSNIEGRWEKTDASAQITLTVEDGQLIGKITAIKNQTRTLDTHNPDATKRTRKLIGLIFLKGFHKQPNKWRGGKVYDARTGKTYSGDIWLEGYDTLIMRAYKGISLIGKSATWKRVK